MQEPVKIAIFIEGGVVTEVRSALKNVVVEICDIDAGDEPGDYERDYPYEVYP